jgi:hypothetical protein
MSALITVPGLPLVQAVGVVLMALSTTGWVNQVAGGLQLPEMLIIRGFILYMPVMLGFIEELTPTLKMKQDVAYVASKTECTRKLIQGAKAHCAI